MRAYVAAVGTLRLIAAIGCSSDGNSTSDPGQGASTTEDREWLEHFGDFEVEAAGPLLLGKLYEQTPLWYELLSRPLSLLLYDDSIEE